MSREHEAGLFVTIRKVEINRNSHDDLETLEDCPGTEVSVLFEEDELRRMPDVFHNATLPSASAQDILINELYKAAKNATYERSV